MIVNSVSLWPREALELELWTGHILIQYTNDFQSMIFYSAKKLCQFGGRSGEYFQSSSQKAIKPRHARKHNFSNSREKETKGGKSTLTSVILNSSPSSTFGIVVFPWLTKWYSLMLLESKHASAKCYDWNKRRKKNRWLKVIVRS